MEQENKVTQSKCPLAGVKVASFCWIAAGPLSVKYLGMWGATVVRVESHTRPDLVRLMGPYKDGQPGIDNNAWFPNVNSSSYSASIDIQKPRGKEIAWKLIKWADVVANNFVPGQMEKWGLGYEEVKKVKPDIIYFSSCQLGSFGPYSTRAGSGWEASAMAGFTHLNGWPDRPPVPYAGAYTDFTAPRFSAAAILAALDYRRRTGKGQQIDQSQAESGCYLLAPPIMDYFANGRVLERQGNSLSYAAPHAIYQCKGDDTWCAITVFTDEQWMNFCRIIGNPEWSKEERFQTLAGRKQSEQELDKLVTQWAKTHTPEEIEKLMTGANVPASVVESSAYLLEKDQHIKTRGFFRKLNHSVIGEHIYRGPAFRMSETKDCQFAGPAIGEHNEYVFKELLGMTDDEIADGLVEGGISTDADLAAGLFTPAF